MDFNFSYHFTLQAGLEPDLRSDDVLENKDDSRSLSLHDSGQLHTQRQRKLRGTGGLAYSASPGQY